MGLWNVVVFNPSGDSGVLYDGFKIVEFAGRQIAFGLWEEFTIASESLVELGVNVPPGIENLFVLVKKTCHIGYSGTWSGGINVSRRGREVALESGNGDFDIHIRDPESGFYILAIRSTLDSATGKVRVSSCLDTLLLGEWTIGEVLRPYGCDWMQFDVPPDQSALYFESEGIGLWNTLDVYYSFIGDSARHWQFSNMGAGYHIEGEIQNPAAGRYYLKYMDSAVLLGGGGQTRQYMIIASTDTIFEPPPAQPSIAELSTYRGGTAGPVTVTIKGAGLDSAAAVSLTRQGHPEVQAGGVVGDSTKRRLVARFDLSGTDPGQWVLKVTNPGGAAAVAPGSFVVEHGAEVDLRVGLVGRHKARAGRVNRCFLRYWNAGNVDDCDLMLWFDTPPTWAIDPVDLPDAWPFAPDTARQAGPYVPGPDSALCVWINNLAPGVPLGFELQVGCPHTGQGLIEYLYVKAPPYEHQRSKPGGTPGPIRRTWYPDGTEPPRGSIAIRLSRGGCFGHVGIYVGNGRVVDLVPIGYHKTTYVVRDTSIAQCWTPALEGRYLGSGTPDGWTPELGDYIADEAMSRAEETGVYFVVPPPFTKNCVRFVREVYASFGLDLKYGAFTTPASIYEYLSSGTWPESKPHEFVAPSHWFPELLPQTTPMAFPMEFVSSSTPEDKYGPVGYDPAGTSLDSLRRFVPGHRELPYRVDFWNAETASAPAQEVFIVDTVDANFADTTLAFIQFGFLRWTAPLEGGQYFNINMDMRPDDSLIVNVEGKYDPDSREISWTFRSLDPVTMEPPEDPMRGFLPPITETGYEIGWVDFTVKTKPNLPTGTRIANQARVKFDVGPWKPAPKEGPYVNTIDASAPSSEVQPLAEYQPLTSFDVTASGEDGASGSGIRGYYLYVSDDDGPYSLCGFIDSTTVAFTGENDHTYKFYSVAVDNVGNREATPADYDAITTVKQATGVEVSPNPFVPSRGHEVISFFGAGVPNAEIKVFNKAGELVATLEEEDGVDRLDWNATGDNGKPLASGVYIYVATEESGTVRKGKFAIIR